jgi:hypothetical protein
MIVFVFLNNKKKVIKINNKKQIYSKNNTKNSVTTEPFVLFDYKNDKIVAIENNILIKPSELDSPYVNRDIENVNSNEEREELELNLNKLYNSSTQANVEELYDYLTSI